MIRIRKSNDRGETQTGWLKSYHSFSFNNYFDQANMGFSDLRVINEDFIKEGAGFGTHSHRDMEIITYVMKGVVQHRDSTGGQGLIRQGEFQRMTAGTGVSHSEFNNSKLEPVHLFQIWVLPEKQGLKPGYEQKAFSTDEHQGKFRLVASRDGRDGSLTINQDTSLFIADIKGGDELSYSFTPNRKGWLQVATGSLTVGDKKLEAGDGAAISDEAAITLRANNDARVLLFDLA